MKIDGIQNNFAFRKHAKIDFWHDQLTEKYLSVDYSLINIISDAVFNSAPLSETRPRCSTDNCIWPSFISLSFCFKCQNISQSVQNGSTYVDNSKKTDFSIDFSDLYSV